MPEFYSIAIYRKDEYAATGVPVITIVKAVRVTIWQILIYTILYALSVLFLGTLGHTTPITTATLAAVNSGWTILALTDLRQSTVPETWAKRMSRYSLLSVLVLCLMLSVDALLP